MHGLQLCVQLEVIFCEEFSESNNLRSVFDQWKSCLGIGRLMVIWENVKAQAYQQSLDGEGENRKMGY